jgi:hypothetical protein
LFFNFVLLIYLTSQVVIYRINLKAYQGLQFKKKHTYSNIEVYF